LTRGDADKSSGDLANTCDEAKETENSPPDT